MPAINAGFGHNFYAGDSMDSVVRERAPPPEWIANFSCHHPLQATHMEYVQEQHFGFQDLVRCCVLFILTVLILLFNIIFLCGLHTQQFKKHMSTSTVCLLTSLSLTDLLTGLLVTAPGFYPAIIQCWPFGQLSCQIQGWITGSLRQLRAFTLIIIALERYVYQINEELAESIFSYVMCLVYTGLSVCVSFSMYSVAIISSQGFYFNVSAFSVCEPYFISLRLLVLTSCVFYFPTTMTLMYCYGSIFHSQKLQLKNRNALRATLPMMIGISVANRPLQYSERSLFLQSLVKSISALSLSFIILSTPWSILQVITSVTREQPPPMLDFFVTLLSTLQSILSPIIFYLLTPKFRIAVASLLNSKCSNCCIVSNCCKDVTIMDAGDELCTPDVIAEKMWGDILERAHSNIHLDSMRRQ